MEAHDRGVSRFAVIVAAAIMTTACTERLPSPEYADWTIPVPEGVPVLDHAYVSIEERLGRVLELTEEAVFSERTSDPETTFYWPKDPVVDGNGRIFVPDTGNHRIQVFDADGAFIETIGRQGGGPGEFEDLSTVLIAGDKLWAYDQPRRRFAFFDLNAEYLGEGDIWDDVPFFYRAEGLHDGSAAVQYHAFLPERAYVLARANPTGDRQAVFASVPDPTETDSLPYAVKPEPTVAAGSEGRIFVTAAQEYQVHCYGADDQHLWALRVDWPRVPIDEEVISGIVERSLEFTPEDAARTSWPETLPAIRWIGTDDAGNLYVFPNVGSRGPERMSAVDIYAPNGERLFAGFMTLSSWDAKQGPYLFTLRYQREDFETAIVRRYELPEIPR